MVRNRHPYLEGQRPLVIAHRGLPSAEVLDNSMLAFAQAQAAGCEYFETDVRVTADGDAVLFHDETLKRFFNDPRPLSSISTRELEERMADRGGLATLPEALAAFPTCRFNIDVKSDDGPVPVAEAIAGHTARVLLTSFDAKRRERALARLRTLDSSRPAVSPATREIASMVTLTKTRQVRRLARFLERFDAVQIPRHIPQPVHVVGVYSPTLVKTANRVGTDVHVWTINDAPTMRTLVARGVSGIITDDAPLALRTLGEASAS